MRIYNVNRGGATKVLFLRLLIALLFLTFSRILIYFFNTSLFADLGFQEFIFLLFAGLHFDIYTLGSLNLAYIVLMSFPWKIKYHKAYVIFSDFVFYSFNILGLYVNFSDVVYFRFTRKRTTWDIFDFLDKNGQEMISLIPDFIRDFWFAFILWLATVAIFILFSLRIRIDTNRYGTYRIRQTLIGIPIFIAIFGVTVVAIRGGIQSRPINIINAGEYTSPRYFPIVLNTPFTILKTINESALEEVSYFESQEELDAVFNPEVRQINNGNNPEKYNVVLLILESFGAEHSAYLNPSLENGKYLGYTPFLDSLMKNSLVFKGFANGQRSIDGVPAILSSLPGLMETPYLSSPYIGNDLESMASLLKKEGYATAFFHGGKNGTMGFEAYTKLVGFDKYYGMDEYGNDDDFDGKWGIFDEPFLQYTGEIAGSMDQPFFSTIFTLSSHHPYTIPGKYKGKFRKGKLDIHESIMYSDYALSRFFKAVRDEPWFENTLFVLTADHCSESYYPFYVSRIGQYSIPIIFYNVNENWSHLSNNLAQQTDILPSVMDYLGLNQDFITFGNSVFDTVSQPFAIMYHSRTYQLIVDSLVYQFDGKNDVGLFNYKRDSLLKDNLISKRDSIAGEMNILTKAIIQQYNNRVIHNGLTSRK